MSSTQKTLDYDSEPVIRIKGDELQVREIPAEQYLVLNQTKSTQYVVDTEEDECTCEAFKFNDGPCKHLEAVEQVKEEESEAGDIPKVDEDGCHTHEVKKIECPDCGGDAVAGQYSRDTYTNHGPNVQRKTRILCSECGTIREENDHSTDREL